MKTTAKRLRQAEQELERRRAEAEKTLRTHQEIAYQKVPALAALERRIAESGAAAVSAIGAGQDSAQLLARLARESGEAQAERARLLRENGFPPGYLQPGYRCPDCMDTGFVRGLRCECFKTLLRNMAYRELCMDAPMERSSFECFRLDYYGEENDPATGVSPRRHMEGVLAFCKAYADAFGPSAGSLLFYGPTGLGKTHLSLAIARQVIGQGFGVIYGSVQNLLGRMEREHFSRYGESGAGTEESLLSCDLLILDDLGAEFPTSFSASAIYNIVNTRLNRALPTIVNTNLSPRQREEKYGERVSSRIIGNYTTLRFFGADIRQVKRALGNCSVTG